MRHTLRAKKMPVSSIAALIAAVIPLFGGCAHTPTSPSTPVVAAGTIRVHDLSASVTATTGCPSTVRFSGTITVSGAGTLTYRWDLADGTHSSAQELYLNIENVADVRLTTRVEDYSVTAVRSGAYSATLHVLSPTDASSTPATCTVTCGAD